MKSIFKEHVKSGALGWLPSLLIAASLMLVGVPPARADNEDHPGSARRPGAEAQTCGDNLLAGVLHDTYWRWLYGNTTLPTDENTNAVLNGIALLPLPSAPGDGTPGSIDITLRGGQPFFLPLFGFQGTSYTDGTPPDAFLDLDIFKTLAINFTIDGKTVVNSRNVMDYYAQSLFVPPIPFIFGNLDSIIWFQSIGVLGEALAPGKHVLKLDVKNTIPGFGYISEFHNTFNLTVAPRVVPQTERFKGRTYAEWSAKWQQWALEFPVDQPNRPHPSVDSPQFDVRAGQSGDVWFLAAPFGTVERSITVPRNKSLFFPVLNVEVSTLEGSPFFGATEAARRTQAKFIADHIVSPFCTVDGVTVGPLSSYRVSSAPINFNAPSPWVNGLVGGAGHAVGDGYYILLESLPTGDHMIHFGGSFHFNAGEVPEFGPAAVDLPIEMTYHVMVK